MNIFKRLIVMFTYSSEELEEILEDLRLKEENRIREATKDYIELCVRHQPKSPGSHYDEHNCDHCRLQARLDEACRVSDIVKVM